MLGGGLRDAASNVLARPLAPWLHGSIGARAVLSAWLCAAVLAATVPFGGVPVRPAVGFGRCGWREQTAGLLLQLWSFVLIPTVQFAAEPFAVDWDAHPTSETSASPRTGACSCTRAQTGGGRACAHRRSDSASRSLISAAQ